MNIILNNIPTKLPDDYMSVENLVEWKGIKKQGTAIAVNDIIVRKDDWELTKLHELDRVTIISAAFGG